MWVHFTVLVWNVALFVYYHYTQVLIWQPKPRAHLLQVEIVFHSPGLYLCCLFIVLCGTFFHFVKFWLNFLQQHNIFAEYFHQEKLTAFKTQFEGFLLVPWKHWNFYLEHFVSPVCEQIASDKIYCFSWRVIPQPNGGQKSLRCSRGALCGSLLNVINTPWVPQHSTPINNLSLK